MASRVGLGWSLVSGGMISRVVSGLPDETINGYFNKGGELTNLTSAKVDELINGSRDGEPDLFSFNCGGYSGQFYFNKDQIPVLVPRQDIKIEWIYQNNQFVQFIITTPDGIRHIFGSYDGVTAYDITYASLSADPYYSTWHLMRIESMDGLHYLNFNYEDDNYSYNSLSSCNWFTSECIPGVGGGWANWNSGSWTQGESCASNTFYQFGNKTHYYNTTNIVGKRLAGITSFDEEIEFVSDTSRMDLGPSGLSDMTDKKRLDRILVKTGSGQNTYCKKFELTYGYFEANDADHALLPDGKRLKLKEVFEKSCDESVQKSPFQFQYNEAINLPWRLAKSRDHWDYLNGKIGNELEFVNVPHTEILLPDGTSATYGNADRNTDTTHLQAGILTKITYPTGGSTTLEYEAHRHTVDIAMEAPLFEVSSCNPPPSVLCCGDPLIHEEIRTLAVSDTSGLGIKLRLVRLPQFCPTVNVGITMYVYNGTTLVQPFPIGFSIAQGQDPDNQGVEIDLPSNFSSVLQPNIDYRIVLHVTNGWGRAIFYNSNVSREDEYVGGLRIKKLNIHDGISVDNDIKRTYQYVKANGESSGIILHQPLYGNALLASAGGSQQGTWFEENVQSITFNTQSFVPRSSFESNHIGYERVIEIQEGNGQTIYNFSVNRDIEHLFSPAHPKPPRDINVFNGTEVNRQVLKLNEEVVSSLSTQPSGQYPASQSVGRMVRLSAPLSCGPNSIVFPSEFSILTDQYRAARITSVLDGVSTVSDYVYDAANRFLMPVREEMTNSAPESGNPQMFITEYKYPQDFPSQPAEVDLVDRNILVPIEITKKVDEVVWDRTWTEYGLFITSNGIFPYPRIFYRDEYTQGHADLGVRQAEILGYDTLTGKPAALLIDGWNHPSYFFWNSNGLIDSTSFIDFGHKYEYHPDTRLLSRVINTDGTAVSYTYDQLCRLDGIFDECRGVATTINYSYGAPDTGGNLIHTIIDYPSVALSDLDSIQNREYFDGLGRVIQQIGIFQGPSITEDIVTATNYDNEGRVESQFEPTAIDMNDGAFVSHEMMSGWQQTVNTYEMSPLNRLHTVTPPQWYPTTYTYGKNTSAIAGYAVGELSKMTTIDEDGHEATSFQDKRGRKVLNRMTDALNTGILDTETIYDQKDRPIAILPPGADLQDLGLGFFYHYYGNDLVRTKKIPDQEEIDYRYDKRDLLIHYQDGYLRDRAQWFSNTYDDYGRLKASGFTDNPEDQNSGASPMINASDTLHSYEYGNTRPVVDKLIRKKIRILESDGSLGGFLTALLDYNDPCNRLSLTRQNNLLDADISVEMMSVVYDGLDNVVEEVYHQDINNDVHSIRTRRTIDFAGRSKSVLHKLDNGHEQELVNTLYTAKGQIAEHRIGKVGSSYLQVCDYDYLPNRFISAINDPHLPGGDLFSMDIHYDQVMPGSGGMSKKDGNISEIITRVSGEDRMIVGYEYDIFDRLKESITHNINSSNQLFNGGKFNTSYLYDERGNFTRMTRNGQYIESGNYQSGQVDDLVYKLQDGTNKIDSIIDQANIPLKHHGVSDPRNGPFDYDANGNMTLHPGKNATIEYNHLNLPFKVDFGFGNSIQWTYDADGTLLRKEVLSNTDVYEDRYYISSTEYRKGSMVQVNHDYGRLVLSSSGCHQNQHIDGLLVDSTDYSGTAVFTKSYIADTGDILFEGQERVQMLPGFKSGPGALFKATIAPCSAESWHYEYTLKDHLGNTRVLFADLDSNGVIDPETEILDESHYYPFGMRMDGTWDSRKIQDQQYKYNGKEEHEDFGLDWIHYGARFYDPGIGRWTGVDPEAESYSAYSPFAYVLNRPINAIDPNGGLVIFVNGFMLDHWSNRDNNKYLFHNHYGPSGYVRIENPNYNPYPPSRDFSNFFPVNNGKSFDYWGAIDDIIMRGFNDLNSLYINASDSNTSQASERFNEGIRAAEELISQLENKKIELSDDETIKIIGHSQGAAFAAGMLKVLANSDYAWRVEVGLYIAPHQPADFSHPKSIDGIQWSTKSDWVSSTDWMWFGANGGSSLEIINGVPTAQIRDKYIGGRAGHSVDTYINNLVRYFRKKGVKVNVFE